MGQSQLTIVDALSEGADTLLSFPPETGADTGTVSRIRVEVGVSPLARAAVGVPAADGTTRKRVTGSYRRWARHGGRIPYVVFVLGVAVGAFARGTTRTPPERAVAPQVVAWPPTSLSGGDIQLVSADVRGTAGVEQSRAVDVNAAVSRSLRVRRESPRSRPASGVRPARHLGTLRVDSTPSGADVFLNGRLAGQTPLVVRAMPVGSRAVRVSREGYAVWSRGIRIVADQATAVSARLDRKQ